MTNEQIITEAMGPKGISEISQEAQYYRSYGKLPEVPVAQASNPSGVNFTATPISATNISNPVYPQIPSPSASSLTDYNAILAGIKASTTEQTAEEKALATSQQTLKDYMTQLEGEAGYQGEQEEKYDLTEKQKTVNDLTAQSNALQAEAASEQIQAKARAQSGTFLTAGLQTEMSQIEANRASKALVLSAQLQAAQGNLTLAQSQIDRAISLKYDGIKNQIENWKTLYDLNKDSLTTAEKKQGDAQKLAYDIWEKQINEQIAAEKDFETAMNTALANGAPLNAITQARNLYGQGNEDAARALVSSYMGGFREGTSPEQPYAPNIPGLTKSQAQDIYTSTTPPAWFKTQEQNKVGASLAPEELQRRWDEYVASNKKTSASSNSNTLSWENIP